jgi:osmotically-inducible protein OsmY
VARCGIALAQGDGRAGPGEKDGAGDVEQGGKEDTMSRHLAIAFTYLATIAILSGGCSNAPYQSGANHGGDAAPEKKSLGDSIGDATLTASVKLSLAFGRGVRGSDISVHTDHRVVILSGKVDSEAERQLAGRIAGGTEGVQDVVNLLEVRG